MNHESRKNRSAYMREYRQRPEVIKKERLRLKLRTEMRRETTIHDLDEVSEIHLFRVKKCNFLQFFQNMGFDGDDESETGLKVRKE